MSSKVEVEVIIDGKVLTLSGFERPEYLQQVANYMNNKISAYNKLDSFKRQSVDMKNILLQLNIADDYFKAKEQADVFDEEIEIKNKELYDRNHELISVKLKLEETEKEKEELEKLLKDAQLRIVKLETELEKNRKSNTYKAVK